MAHTAQRVEGTGLRMGPGSVRTWLGADAVLTGVNGLAYVLAAGPLVEVLGAEPWTFRLIGAFLLLFTVMVARVARSTDPHDWALRLIVLVNVLWMAASLVIAASGTLDLTSTGRVWVVAQGVVVGVLAVLQVRTGRHG